MLTRGLPSNFDIGAEQNGYDVEGLKYNGEISRAIREQHADAIERVKKGAEAESRLNLPDAASVEKGKPAEQPTIAQTEKTTSQQAEIARETIEKAANKKRSLLSGPAKLAKNLLLDVGEQIRDISPRVFGRLMKTVELEPRQRIAATRSELAPGLKRINEFLGKPGTEHAEKWHELWLDQDGTGLRAMLPENLRPDFDAVYPYLRDLHAREVKMGIREGTLGKEYLPSSVRDLDLLRSLHPEKMGEIEEAWQLRQAAEGRPLTDAERLDVANNVAAGYGPTPGGGVRPGFAKERSRGKLTAEERAAYERWDTALLHRIERGEMAIGKAEFFGKGNKPTDLMTSIGKVLTEEIEAGRLKGEKQRELTALLHTRFMGDANTPGRTVRHIRQAIHLVALSHITSGLRQLTDLATTAGRHGLVNTINAAGDALRFQGKDRALFLHSLGLDPVHHDFVDLNLLGKAVDK